MSTNLPPVNPDEQEQPSLFEDFINRSLDLDGLEPEPAPDDESAFPFADGERVTFHLQLPNGGPLLTGALGAGLTDVGASRLPSLPMSSDVRWQTMKLVGRPARLRLHQPMFDYRFHTGQMILMITARFGFRLQLIRDVRPGWNAVRFRAGRGMVGEYIEWRGNTAAKHQLQLEDKDITGFIRSEAMPEMRPARKLPMLGALKDVAWLLLEIAVLVIVAAWLVAQIAFGGQPTTADLQNRIATLEAQVSALESSPAPSAPAP